MNGSIHNRFVVGEDKAFGEVRGADKPLEIALRGLAPLNDEGVAIQELEDGLSLVQVRGIASKSEWDRLLELAEHLAAMLREIGLPFKPA